MFENTIKKIKSCLPKKREYQVHEPQFDLKASHDTKKCIQSTMVSSNGKYLDMFSCEINKITDAKKILLTNSGTSALFLSMKLINVKDTEVLVPSMTFAATVNSILYNDGIPHFIDCSDSSPNIDVNILEDYLKNNTYTKINGLFNKKTKKMIKCLIIVHAYGEPVNMAKVKQISKNYNIEVIEDAAGALGSFYKNRHVGTTSRAAIISFNGNKIVTTGMGGAILLKNTSDYKKIRHIMSTSRIKHPWKVEHDGIGYNMRMANINAALGLSQLKNIKVILQKKRRLFLKYKNILKDDKYCHVNTFSKESSPNHWVVNITLKDKFIQHQQRFFQELHSNNIYAREVWKPQHLSSYLQKYPRSNLQNTIKIWKSSISLPSSDYL